MPHPKYRIQVFKCMLSGSWIMRILLRNNTVWLRTPYKSRAHAVKVGQNFLQDLQEGLASFVVLRYDPLYEYMDSGTRIRLQKKLKSEPTGPTPDFSTLALYTSEVHPANVSWSPTPVVSQTQTVHLSDGRVVGLYPMQAGFNVINGMSCSMGTMPPMVSGMPLQAKP